MVVDITVRVTLNNYIEFFHPPVPKIRTCPDSFGVRGEVKWVCVLTLLDELIIMKEPF